MVFRNKKGEIIRVYPYGSEEQKRFERGIELLYRLYKLHVEEQTEKRLQKEQIINNKIAETDKKIFKRHTKRSTKIYNLTQAAVVLGVHRETLYYWMKKGWIKPKRDYRNYPIFTVLDIENMIKWKNTIKS